MPIFGFHPRLSAALTLLCNRLAAPASFLKRDGRRASIAERNQGGREPWKETRNRHPSSDCKWMKEKTPPAGIAERRRLRRRSQGDMRSSADTQLLVCTRGMRRAHGGTCGKPWASSGSWRVEGCEGLGGGWSADSLFGWSGQRTAGGEAADVRTGPQLLLGLNRDAPLLRLGTCSRSRVCDYPMRDCSCYGVSLFSPLSLSFSLSLSYWPHDSLTD